MENNRDFKGVWIPREVWLSKELTMIEKAILVEINSLDGEEGCFATNEYLAEFCNTSIPTITRSISKLKKLGYVYDKAFNGRVRVLKSSLIKMINEPNQIDEADKSKRLGDKNNIKNNTNIIKENKKKVDVDLFVGYSFSDNVKQAVNKWLAYKKEKGQTYKQTGLTTLLNKVKQGLEQYGEQVVSDSIDNCISNNYAGLFINKPNYGTRKEPKNEIIKQEYSKEEINSVFRNIKDIDLDNWDI